MVIEAKYENGVFRPLGKVTLKEGTVVVQIPMPSYGNVPTRVAPKTDERLWLSLGFAYMVVITGICLRDSGGAQIDAYGNLNSALQKRHVEQHPRLGHRVGRHVLVHGHGDRARTRSTNARGCASG